MRVAYWRIRLFSPTWRVFYWIASIALLALCMHVRWKRAQGSAFPIVYDGPSPDGNNASTINFWAARDKLGGSPALHRAPAKPETIHRVNWSWFLWYFAVHLRDVSPFSSRNHDEVFLSLYKSSETWRLRLGLDDGKVSTACAIRARFYYLWLSDTWSCTIVTIFSPS